MIHHRCYLIPVIMFALSLVACETAERLQATSGSTSGISASPDSIATATTSASSPVPAFTGMPPQTNAAEIRPPERREELTQLSNLLQFKVTSLNGVELGTISDFIINTCETYIIYFKVDPAPELNVASGNQLVIPFEVVTINSGALDAEAKVIALYLMPEQVASAPVFADPLPLFPNTWEETVRDYWLQVARVSHLTSECKAGGSTSATNIAEDDLKPENTIELILLTENNLLLGAPRITSVEEALSVQTQNVARQYWGQ
jgi:sporulation protein YlmC with PRC-barrel domain